MKNDTEKLTKYLQNFATVLGLTVNVFNNYNDRRKKTKWFLSKNGISVSPVLDYDNLNSFMIGWESSGAKILFNACMKSLSALKSGYIEDRAMALENNLMAIKTHNRR